MVRVLLDHILRLHQHAPGHRPQLQRRGAGRGGGAHGQQAQVPLLLEHLQGPRRELRRQDDLVEHALHGLGHGPSDRPVAGYDAAEGRHRVAGVGAAVGLGHILVEGQAAGVGVLHHRHGRRVEAHHHAPGGVGVDDVVVGELLAVELPGRGDSPCARRGRVEGSLLVGVLAVAQVHHLPEPHRQLLGQGNPLPAGAQEVGDGRVVSGQVGEGLARQLLALR